MEAKDIMDKKFDKSFNGYKMEEVDDFLQEVSAEFSNLKKQYEEQEKKMEVLADKIREYRNDEEAIKEALLGAQKQSSSVLATAKEKSEKMVSEAKETSERMIKDAEERVKEKDAYAKKLVEDANEEKTKIVAECERKSAEIKANMEAEIRKQESILAKTRDESNAFMERLLKGYQEHIEYINSIPEKCNNEFVLNAKDTVKFTEESKPASEAAVAAPAKAETGESASAPKSEGKKKEKELKLEKINKESEAVILEKTTEIASKPVFEEEAVAEEVEEYEENSPLFDKTKRKSKYEKLQFGNNNKSKE
ncbi:MAG: DivIVA domain-containing protein [Bacteroides sp.]|nr:DivIVA domain-containing protein [Bacteroides sp.]